MGVFTVASQSTGGELSAKQLSGELEATGVSTYELQRRLGQAALAVDSSGGINSSMVSPSSSVFQNLFRTREVRELVSGALAGAMAKAVLAPLETIRTRMIVGVGSKHIAGSFVEIVEKNGWQGLWAGNTINMIRIIPTQAIELATFERVKRNMTSIQEHWKENGSPKLQIGHINLDLSFLLVSPVAIGGAAAGIASTLMSHPLEVIKDRLTVNREAYPSISLAFSRISKKDG